MEKNYLLQKRRPDCFEYAMSFLGGNEEKEIREYIEKLEFMCEVSFPVIPKFQQERKVAQFVPKSKED